MVRLWVFSPRADAHACPLVETAMPGYLQMTMEQIQIQERKIGEDFERAWLVVASAHVSAKGSGSKGLIKCGVIVDPAWKHRNPNVRLFSVFLSSRT